MVRRTERGWMSVGGPLLCRTGGYSDTTYQPALLCGNIDVAYPTLSFASPLKTPATKPL